MMLLVILTSYKFNNFMIDEVLQLFDPNNQCPLDRIDR